MLAAKEIFNGIDDSRYYGDSVADGKRLIGQAENMFNPYSEKLLEHLDVAEGSVGLALDIGCGPAAAAPLLTKYAKYVIGIDNDDGKFSQGARLLTDYGLRERYKLVHSDAGKLPEFTPGSVGLVFARFWGGHVNEKTRNSFMERVTKAAMPGAFLVWEDFDLGLETPTWRSFPQSSSHRFFHEAMVSLYELRGAEPRMGPKAPGLVSEYGWQPQHMASYNHLSRWDEESVRFHWGIIDMMKYPMTKVFKIMTEETFAFNRAMFERDLITPNTLVCAPRVDQLIAVLGK